MTQLQTTIKPGAIALMAMMLATRFDHFGTAFVLPDASLAVFFLAGLWFGGRYLFAALLLEAGLIDYLAISQFGVSDFCISTAYVFLIPTYALIWWGGYHCQQYAQQSVKNALWQFFILVNVVSAAFVVSNASFYLLSTNIAEGSWGHYLDQFARYYPAYLSSALIYALAIWAVVNVVKFILPNKVSGLSL